VVPNTDDKQKYLWLYRTAVLPQELPTEDVEWSPVPTTKGISLAVQEAFYSTSGSYVCIAPASYARQISTQICFLLH